MKKFTLSHLIIMLISMASYSQTVLSYSYDNAGNQTLRDSGFFSIIDKPDPIEEIVARSGLTYEQTIQNLFSVSPNPTSGLATLTWEPEIAEDITQIELVSLVTSERRTIAFHKGNSVGINLSSKVTGLYLVVFHLNNPDVPSVEKKIIRL